MRCQQLCVKESLADFATLQEWQITESGKDKLMQGLDRRAVKQQKVLQMLVNGALPHREFVDQEITSTVLKSLEDKGWIERIEKKPGNHPVGTAR